MYGKDIERLLKSISMIIDSVQLANTSMVGSLSRSMITQVDSGTMTISPGDHDPLGPGSHSHTIMPHMHMEAPHNITKLTLSDAAFIDEVQKIGQIEKNLYTSGDKINNSIGSPYNELTSLCNELKKYTAYMSNMMFIGQYIGATLLLHNVAIAAVDAKYAVLQYQDGLQRGYDACCNGGKSSVTWDDFNKGQTDGNVR